MVTHLANRGANPRWLHTSLAVMTIAVCERNRMPGRETSRKKKKKKKDKMILFDWFGF